MPGTCVTSAWPGSGCFSQAPKASERATSERAKKRVIGLRTLAREGGLPNQKVCRGKVRPDPPLRFQVAAQFFPKFRPGAKKEAFDRRHAQFEDIRDLLVRRFLVAA